MLVSIRANRKTVRHRQDETPLDKNNRPVLRCGCSCMCRCLCAGGCKCCTCSPEELAALDEWYLKMLHIRSQEHCDELVAAAGPLGSYMAVEVLQREMNAALANLSADPKNLELQELATAVAKALFKADELMG
jgi:hypothetical protein